LQWRYILPARMVGTDHRLISTMVAAVTAQTD
jgi:hypothetical protein